MELDRSADLNWLILQRHVDDFVSKPMLSRLLADQRRSGVEKETSAGKPTAGELGSLDTLVDGFSLLSVDSNRNVMPMIFAGAMRSCASTVPKPRYTGIQVGL